MIFPCTVSERRQKRLEEGMEIIEGGPEPTITPEDLPTREQVERMARARRRLRQAWRTDNH